MTTTNPYNYTQPVQPVRPEMFCGREQDLSLLVNELVSPSGMPYALVGGHKIGKTSLLEALLSRLQQMQMERSCETLPIPILLKLNDPRIVSAEAFFAVVCQATQKALDSELPLSASEGAAGEGTRVPYVLAFEEKLQNWGQAVQKRCGRRLRLILLLDDCEYIVDQVWIPDLYEALQRLLTTSPTRPLLGVILAGTRRFLDDVYHPGSPLRPTLVRHALGVLDATATRELITQRGQVKLPEAVIAEIAAQTGGHPFLVQYIMHHLWHADLQAVTVESVRGIAVARFFLEPEVFEEWVKGLGDTAQQVFTILDQAQHALSEDQIRASMRRAPADLRQALNALCYHGVVSRELKQGYTIAGHMFREWFKQRFPSELVPPPPLQPHLCTQIRQRIGRGEIIAFVGAGLSVGARLPGWYDLVSELAGRIAYELPPRQYASSDHLIEAAQAYINEVSLPDLVSFLKDKLDTTGKLPTAAHLALARLPISLVFTANYDNLLELAYRDVGKRVTVVVRDDQIPYINKGQDHVTVVKLYGDLDNPDSIVFARQQYESFFQQRPQMRRLLEVELARSDVLYLGWSHTDPYFNVIYGDLLSCYGQHLRPGYALMFDITEARRKELERKKIHVGGLPLGDRTANLTAWLHGLTP